MQMLMIRQIAVFMGMRLTVLSVDMKMSVGMCVFMGMNNIPMPMLVGMRMCVLMGML